MRETILIFQMDDKKMKAAVTAALLPLKVRVKAIPQTDFHKKLGVLAGILEDTQITDGSAADPAAQGPLSDSMMILCGINDAKLNRILAALRSKNVRIPYKAVLTASNQEWTAYECLEELKKEHEAFASGQPIHDPQ